MDFRPPTCISFGFVATSTLLTRLTRPHGVKTDTSAKRLTFSGVDIFFWTKYTDTLIPHETRLQTDSRSSVSGSWR